MSSHQPALDQVEGVYDDVELALGLALAVARLGEEVVGVEVLRHRGFVLGWVL